MKSDDFEAAIGCHACHDWIDGRVPGGRDTDMQTRLFYFYRGVERTHRYWLSQGLLLRTRA